MAAAAPESEVAHRAGRRRRTWRQAFADRAGRVVGMAAETTACARTHCVRGDRLVLLAVLATGVVEHLPARVPLRRAGGTAIVGRRRRALPAAVALTF